MELRQLCYFVTLAEELHFGRAAAREHIAQSALSQQLVRLEHELAVSLLECTTHRVRLTAAGSAFLGEVRQILAHVNRATVAARRAAESAPTLRVGIVDASYDTMPIILRRIRARFPELAVHQVEVGVPEQFKLLAGGRLDVGFGRAWSAPAEVDFELVRLDPLGVFVARDHRLCVLCAPASCSSSTAPPEGIVWRPLIEPETRYPWSVLWRAGNHCEYVRAVVETASGLAAEHGWLPPGHGFQLP